MEKNIVQIQLPEDLVNYIESLSYEVGARKDMLAFMVDRGMMGTEGYEKYHDSYLEFYSKYEIAKRDLEARFVRPNHPNCTWSLDFDTGVLSIEVKDT